MTRLDRFKLPAWGPEPLSDYVVRFHYIDEDGECQVEDVTVGAVNDQDAIVAAKELVDLPHGTKIERIEVI